MIAGVGGVGAGLAVVYRVRGFLKVGGGIEGDGELVGAFRGGFAGATLALCLLWRDCKGKGRGCLKGAGIGEDIGTVLIGLAFEILVDGSPSTDAGHGSERRTRLADGAGGDILFAGSAMPFS